MKKLLALLLCVAFMLSFAAMAEDGRVHITYSYWGTPDEAAATQAVLDTYNGLQDEVFVELLCIPNEQYTAKLQSMAIAGELPDRALIDGLSRLHDGDLVAEKLRLAQFVRREED